MSAVAGVVLGGGLLVLGWVLASGESTFADQTAALNLALAGAAVAGIGCGLHLVALRRRVADRLVALRLASEDSP